jgi:hypothetical protein
MAQTWFAYPQVSHGRKGGRGGSGGVVSEERLMEMGRGVRGSWVEGFGQGVKSADNEV